MTVAALIEKLQQLPPDAETRICFDGVTRLGADYVWLARGGHVVLADEDEDIYHTHDRPATAPTYEQSQSWKPRGPDPDDE